MKNIYSRITLLSLILLFSVGLSAQTEEMKWNVGLQFGTEQYKSTKNSGFYRFDRAFYGFGGVNVSRYLMPHLDARVNATYGEIGNSRYNKIKVEMFTASLALKYTFFNDEEYRLRPYLFAGGSYLAFGKLGSNAFAGKKQHRLIPNLGAGLTFKLNENINLSLENSFYIKDNNSSEGLRPKKKEAFLQHSIGVSYNLGKAKDDDGDGIVNSKDVCPQVAGIAAFNGCPDTDGDGIADNEDACPTEAGKKEFTGCPDSDEDGIADKDDKCPAVAGLKEFKGCPDTDGDGIADADDPCPNAKGTEGMEGCPDTDGDGIADKDDTCPEAKGSKEMNGCPDSDGDSVADNVDKCPDVAGIAKNKGCPEVKAEEVKVLKQALEGVKFQSGKDILTKSSYAILNKVASVMQKNGAYKLRIEGHTDSQGADASNLELSKKRAKAVKNYLVKKDIAESRLSSEGYGETKPISDNSTSAGRAENRRVELTIEF